MSDGSACCGLTPLCVCPSDSDREKMFTHNYLCGQIIVSMNTFQLMLHHLGGLT